MPRFEPNPERRPAVVTGASSGIGQATAKALAALGHPVVLGARRVAECEDTAAAIRAEGGEAVAIHLDLADGDSVEQFAKAAVDALGEVEILVSNAAQNMAGSVLDTDPDGVRRGAPGQRQRHPPAGPRPGPGHDERAGAATSSSSPPTWSSAPDRPWPPT